jgi:hypothetical protein
MSFWHKADFFEKTPKLMRSSPKGANSTKKLMFGFVLRNEKNFSSKDFLHP